MWKQHKLLGMKENSEKTVELWGNETNIPKYDENIADTLTWDENNFNTLKMFQDLTWETWEYYFKDWRWNRLSPEKYEKIKKIKESFHIKIYGTDNKICGMVWEIDDSIIDNIIRDKERLSKIISNRNRDLDIIIFYSKIAETWKLDDFMETFDRFKSASCFVDNIPLIEEIDFPKIKNMKEYIKSKNADIIFDYNTIDRLKSLESIEYVWNILLKWVEKWWENYVIMNVNKLWTDYIRAEKQWENEYIINANMPGNPEMAWRSYILMIQSLPQWAKIIEKESLSINSFNNIINLYSNKKFQERFGIKEVALQDTIWLNNQWKNWELAELIEEKNVWKNGELFETDSKENAELIASKINKLIFKYTWNKSILATVKEIEKEWWDNTWGIKIPGFSIEKY